jgi:predicted RNA-binding protein with PUA-like domain
MKYWLIKSEPNEYSFDDLVKDKKTIWTGIRNYRARNNLKLMKVGDLAFFYHSNERKEIVGIAKVTNEFFQDPTTKEEAWVAVEFAPVKKLEKSVTLEQAKNDSKLKDMELVRLSRLSTSEVTKDEWEHILKLSENNE